MVWLYAEHLTLVYRDEPLAQYRVTYQPDQRRLTTVMPEQRFETPHHSPQPPLWAWSEDDWLPALRLPAYAPGDRGHPSSRWTRLAPKSAMQNLPESRPATVAIRRTRGRHRAAGSPSTRAAVTQGS